MLRKLSPRIRSGMTDYASLSGARTRSVVTLLAIVSLLRSVFSNVQTQLNSVPTS